MSGTYLSLHYHLVFSTKNRQRLLSAEYRTRLYEYLGGTLVGMGATPQAIGGTDDHIHLLVGLKATHTLSDLVRELKKSSSSFMKETSPYFAWQEGYAAFTVSATAREGVKRYIANQEEHHRVKSFIEELQGLLEQAGVEYDSKYLN